MNKGSVWLFVCELKLPAKTVKKGDEDVVVGGWNGR